MALKVGQSIKFRPTHQKELELSGKVKAVRGDLVDVLSDAANGSVSRVHSVHAKDCTAIETPAPAAETKPAANETETAETETAASE